MQVEANELHFYKKPETQKKLRVSSYKGLLDFIRNKATELEVAAGFPIVLPSSYPGSQRAYKELFYDAMSVVNLLGHPDLFVTMTCNPTWREIVENLFPGQTASDRPDLVARVFKMKLDSLLNDIVTAMATHNTDKQDETAH